MVMVNFEMMMKFVYVFILVMNFVSGNINDVINDGKESRFLPIFEVKRYGPNKPQVQEEAVAPSNNYQSSYGTICSERLENALEHLKRRKRTHAKALTPEDPSFDFEDMNVHGKMRSLPVDMYVTRMRVRLPQNRDWVRVEKCYFDPHNSSLDTKLLFNDITISGNVDLYDGTNTLNRRTLSRRHIRDFEPYDNRQTQGCNMILRLRKAGIGFHTRPLHQSAGKFNVKTDSEFVEPGFISVYAYGCEKYISRKAYGGEPVLSRKKRSNDVLNFDSNFDEEALINGRSNDWDTFEVMGGKRLNYERSKLFRPDNNLDEAEEISREMEDIFTKGIRTLLTTYMKKELQPAIKETLIRNLGYVISYGKK